MINYFKKKCTTFLFDEDQAKDRAKRLPRFRATFDYFIRSRIRNGLPLFNRRNVSLTIWVTHEHVSRVFHGSNVNLEPVHRRVSSPWTRQTLSLSLSFHPCHVSGTSGVVASTHRCPLTMAKLWWFLCTRWFERTITFRAKNAFSSHDRIFVLIEGKKEVCTLKLFKSFIQCILQISIGVNSFWFATAFGNIQFFFIRK